jgi:hypothetical protein
MRFGDPVGAARRMCGALGALRRGRRVGGVFVFANAGIKPSQ